MHALPGPFIGGLPRPVAWHSIGSVYMRKQDPRQQLPEGFSEGRDSPGLRLSKAGVSALLARFKGRAAIGVRCGISAPAQHPTKARLGRLWGGWSRQQEVGYTAIFSPGRNGPGQVSAWGAETLPCN